MNESPDKIRNLAGLYKRQNPTYEGILSFYERIAAEQSASSSSVSVTLPAAEMEIKKAQMKEGFPLLEKQDFVLDIDSSKNLFESLCKIAKNENEKMRQNVQAIEEAVTINALNVKELLRRFFDAPFIEKVAGEFDIDSAVLSFLVTESVRPSLMANVKGLGEKPDLRNWLRGYCPICGSLPQISFLKDQGQRFYRCSLCRFEWPSERLKCPFCECTDHAKLQYFYAEGSESRRVDLCENCHKYIKTIDLRKVDYEADLDMEDIATIHLDILASEKGFTRPSPGLWGDRPR